ncbi:MAG: radical SAM protein [Gammaproteobacteria bacterium]
MTAVSSPGNSSPPLSGLHLLLSYKCTFECDHCFVWSGPFQTGTMTLDTVEHILAEAGRLGTIEWIYFEGGEAFLFYAILRSGVLRAKKKGFKVGIVTNAYWANSEDDALEWLRPLAGSVDDLSISSDSYHGASDGYRNPEIAHAAARQLDIPVDFISIAEPGESGESPVLFRGRAAELLASKVPPTPWQQFTTCPWEDLRNPQRVHVDPFGHLHICQGIPSGTCSSARWPRSWQTSARTSIRLSAPCWTAAPQK